MDKEYPKWVQREPHIGPVLCVNKAEEDKLLLDWAEEQAAKAQAEAKAAEAAASANLSKVEIKDQAPPAARTSNQPRR